MANRRVLVKRRKAVRNIRKITRTMQLIATARFQAAFNRATATKPYSEKLAELVADLSRAAAGLEHPLMRTHDQVKRSALVVVTSDRGQCGGYNASILRLAGGHLESKEAAGGEVDVHMVGKKGISYFKFLGRAMLSEHVGIGDKPRFEEIEPIANGLIEAFSKGEISTVNVAYMRFVSAGKQVPELAQLLPLSQQASSEEEAEETVTASAGGTSVEYEFSPDPAELLSDLLPASVRMRLFQCFTDAAVSEQIARMVAMTAATEAASDMITSLTRQYNRARQTHITMELLDIIGGASALG